MAESQTTPEAQMTKAVRALCDLEHNDPCSWPECKCPVALRVEYRRMAEAVITALEMS